MKPYRAVQGLFFLLPILLLAAGCAAPQSSAATKPNAITKPTESAAAKPQLGGSSFFISASTLENKTLSTRIGMATAIFSRGDQCILLTSKHVVKGANVRVRPWSCISCLPTGGSCQEESFAAQVVAEGADDVDAALLRIEKPGGCSVSTVFEAEQEPGTSILLLGQPLEKSGAITRGIISGYWQVKDQGLLMVSDAFELPGYSGGGVFDEHHPDHLIGVITGRTKDQGFSYIVPISRILPLLKKLPQLVK